MNRNQKIGIGCGAAGCLGLIVVAIAGGLGYFFYRSQERGPDYRAARNFNFNTNTNSSGANTNQNSEAASPADGASSYSDDDKHKLFQAAGMAQNSELLQKTLKKIGLFKADGTPAADYEQFVKDHTSWALQNTSFITSINTPEKAKAYVDAHLEE